ncbi:probable WSS1 Protein involved in sister chromatid separation and segregation [Rhynchosporium agropyri]|uniref:Probable WSS1 Protein involved in sister chromatid separation and segregation n=1 Tax=Rhynchosporium agropyri TaxID=914238 RepID=A0A1E1LMK1_9HELO|nr:probable WSS1 Protein involved in sister chromatid separation and segregation [Rhynchosporium agropyri]
MATDSSETGPTDNQDLVSITLTFHGASHTYNFPSDATILDLSDEIADTLSIPSSNQKFMVSKLGLLKPPFKDPNLLLTALINHKITLLGSTAQEASSISLAREEASRRVNRRNARPAQKVKAYKTHDWKKEQEENQYTFTTLRPLPYLPNPNKSLKFLQRLKDDIGIKAAMRRHKFIVPLLTEMNPVEHTQSNYEGTTRTLGLNRNAGEVIELRLRTDAYDGYRDYKTIRKTLCHELAHNVHGSHDRKFWDLCKLIEKEVEKADYTKSGFMVGEGAAYAEGSGEDEEVDDHGGWTGGEFVLGASRGGGAESVGTRGSGEGISRREILAKAAEKRMKRMREQQSGESENAGSESR